MQGLRSVPSMRVLFFYYAESGLVGGVETVVVSMAQSLTQLGHPSGIVYFADSWKPRRLLHESIPIWSIASPSFPALGRPRSWASYLRAVWQFRAVCHEFAPDIVHVQFPLSQCLPVVGAHLLPHQWHLVTTVHNSDIRVSPKHDSRLRAWQKRLFQRSEVVTSVSQGLLKDTIDLYPCVSSNGQVIYNGVEHSWFDQRSNVNDEVDQYVLFVGRLHPMKAVDVLLRAWSLAYPRLAGTQLWLAGNGPERERLNALARELGIEKAVKFLGDQAPVELGRLYRAAQCVVLPSRHEGFPMVLLEAGACGAVCVGTKVPGITEIITDGGNGFLVDVESPEALSEGIIRVVTLSKEERRRMSEAACENVRNQFTQDKIISKYLSLYRDLLEPKG